MNSKNIKAFNPFYFLLVMAGVAFFLTAFCYGLMALHQINRQRDVTSRFSYDASANEDFQDAVNQHGLMQIMDEYGVTIMLWELGILGIATVGAMTTDNFWSNRAAAKP